MGCAGTKQVRDECDELPSIAERGLKRKCPGNPLVMLTGQPIISKANANFCVLLLSQKFDPQLDLFCLTAERLGGRCVKAIVNYSSLATTTDVSKNSLNELAELKTLISEQVVDLIIIDRRNRTSTTAKVTGPGAPRSVVTVHPADQLCISLRGVASLQHTIIAALVNRKSRNQRQLDLHQSLLTTGYNKCLAVPMSSSYVHKELNTFIHNELPLINRLRELEPVGQSRNTTIVSGHTIPDGFAPGTQKLGSCKEHPIDAVQVPLVKITNENGPNSLLDVPSRPERQQLQRFELAQEESAPNHHMKQPTFRSLHSSIPNETFNRDPFDKFLCLTKRDSMVRLQNFNVKSPLCRALTILSSMKIRGSSESSRDLQRAINLICTSDVFTTQVLKPQCNSDRDPFTTDLIGGLMTNAMTNVDGNRVTKSDLVAKELIATVTSDCNCNPTLKQLSKEVEECLRGYDTWNYDILELEDVTQKRPLIPLAMKILRKYKAMQLLRIGEEIMCNWLSLIEENYHSTNPYHNATHAADVMQSAAYLLSTQAINAVMDNMDTVATVLSAVIHDLNHPGRSNPFLVNSNHSLAVLYNDIAVLESHHVALAFELTHKSPEYNIFQNLNRDDYRTIRRYIIDMVLATEMARHFDHVTKFINMVSKPILQRMRDRMSKGSGSSIDSNSCRITVDSCALLRDNSSQFSDEDVSSSAEHVWSIEQREVVKRLIIKCSDVNNPTRPLSMCKVWAGRIAEEYFSQTDEEKRLGLPIVMPNFDRQTCNIAKSQISFIDFFLKDMFNAFDSVFPIPELLQNLNENYEYWTQTIEDEKATPTAKV